MFIAWQSQFVACGYAITSVSMVLKFLIGPVLMLLASLAIGIHSTVLHVAVVQVIKHEYALTQTTSSIPKYKARYFNVGL
jgi:hypothetical protein